MALTEQLRFLITSDSAQARADLTRLSQTTTSTTSRIERLQGEMKKRLVIDAGQVAGQVTAAAGQVAQFAVDQMGQAVAASSRLQQAQGAVKAIFGESASEVRRFADGAVESAGLSKAAYGQFAAQLGALLQNLGQTRAQSVATADQLVRTGADLAAAFGGTTADAVAAIGAALRGERDPIERYGISIKEAAVANKALQMGLAASKDELTDTAKATAAIALIQQQSASTAGQFARESNTLAGQQQRLNAEMENARAELGEALLPVMIELVEVARDVIPVVQFVGAAVTETGKAFADVARTIASWTANVEQAIDTVLPGARQLAGALKDAIRPEQGTLVAEAAAKFDGLAATIDDTADAAASAAPDLATLQSQVSKLASSMFASDNAQAAFYRTISGGGGAVARAGNSAAKALGQIDDATRSLADAHERLQEAQVSRFLTSLGATSDEITAAQIAERESTRSLAQAKRDLAEAQERLQTLRDGDAATLLDAEAANIEAQRAFVAAEATGDAVALKRAKADLLRTEQALAKARNVDVVADLAAAEDDVAAAQDAVTQAEMDARRSRQDLNDTINRGRDGSKELAEANKEVEEAQRAVEKAEWALVDAQDALSGSTAGMAGSTKSANDRFLEGVSAADAWLQKLIDGKASPEEFAGAIGEIRDNLEGVAREAGQTGELDAYLAKISEIYAKISDLNGAADTASGKLSGLVGKSGAVGATAGVSQTVNLTVDGKTFGRMVVDGLVGWINDNGSLPVKIR